ncbi:MAG: hypothetical protein N838_28980 [Thiohalocapsa sp. PB-PSB1]|nr:MAG: hypothetical protein N838_28980 [Thiohalocapsa sp. PB-PSB1]
MLDKLRNRRGLVVGFLIVTVVALTMTIVLFAIGEPTGNFIAIFSAIFTCVGAIGTLWPIFASNINPQPTVPSIDDYLDRAAGETLDLPIHDIFDDPRGELRRVSLAEVFVALDAERIGPADVAEERYRKLTWQRGKGEPVLRTIDNAIREAGEQERPMCITLLGEAGCGKSSLASFLVWGARHQEQAKQVADWPQGLGGRTVLRLNLSNLRRFIRPEPEVRPKKRRSKDQLLRTAVIDQLGVTMTECSPQQCEQLYDDLMGKLKKRGLLIFDGLDEVLDQEDRELVYSAIDFATRELGKECGFLITARPYVYEHAKLPDFQLTRMLPLRFDVDSSGDGQVGELVRKWHRALKLGESERQSLDLISALVEDENRRDMAVRPLMLTLLIGVQEQRRKDGLSTALPSIRVDLLNETTQLMMERWFQRIDLLRCDQQYPHAGHLNMLLEPQSKSGKSELRLIAEQVSYDIQNGINRQHGDTVEDVEITRGDFTVHVHKRLPELNYSTLSQVSQIILERTALWFLRGQHEQPDSSRYAYIHRQFHEFLVASHIVDGNNPDTLLRDRLLENPDAWREVVRLAVPWTARAQTEGAALALAASLCDSTAYATRANASKNI